MGASGGRALGAESQGHSLGSGFLLLGQGNRQGQTEAPNNSIL